MISTHYFAAPTCSRSSTHLRAVEAIIVLVQPDIRAQSCTQLGITATAPIQLVLHQDSQ